MSQSNVHPITLTQSDHALMLFPDPEPTRAMLSALYSGERFTPRMNEAWRTHKLAVLSQQAKRAAFVAALTPGCFPNAGKSAAMLACAARLGLPVIDLKMVTE